MLEYAANGELYRQLAKRGRFSEKRGSRVSGILFSVKLSDLLPLVHCTSCRCPTVSPFKTDHSP
jgi:hypothetical protein